MHAFYISEFNYVQFVLYCSIFCLETRSIFKDKMGHCLSDTLLFPNYLSVILFLL